MLCISAVMTVLSLSNVNFDNAFIIFMPTKTTEPHFPGVSGALYNEGTRSSLSGSVEYPDLLKLLLEEM